MKIVRLAVRAIVLLTTGPALLAFTACTVSSVAILVTIAGQAVPAPAAPGPTPSLRTVPAIATTPFVRPAPAGGAAAAVASVPVGPGSKSRSRAPAASRGRLATETGRAARAEDLRSHTAYFAWITGVRQGRPGEVTMEMAWHYTGQAAWRYAAEHHLGLVMDDHIDIDRRFAVTVTMALSARTSISTDGPDQRPLSASAFLDHAARHLAVKINGQFAGPLYEVVFDHGVLVSACQVFEP